LKEIFHEIEKINLSVSPFCKSFNTELKREESLLRQLNTDHIFKYEQSPKMCVNWL